MDWEILWSALKEFQSADRRLYWPYLLSAFVLAVFVLIGKRKGRSLRASLGIDDEEKRKSALTDLLYFLVNPILYGAFIVPFMFQQESIAKASVGFLSDSSSLVALEGRSVLADALLTLMLVLVMDLTSFLVHRALHKFSFLWAFHKVHHAAESLNPLTVHRSHPLEILLTSSALALTMGASSGIFYSFYPSYRPVEIFGANIFVAAFYFLGYNLRHSPIWLDYPGFLKLFLISPAQHQIHHSRAFEHHDRNFGFIFSLWDRALGTLYVPVEEEDLDFGLGPEEQGSYRRISQLYFQPFIDSVRSLFR